MSVFTGNHDGHVVVKDLDRQVIPALPEELLALPQEDDARSMMRVDDVIALLEGALHGVELGTDLDLFLYC
jgi:hypothetical protein